MDRFMWPLAVIFVMGWSGLFIMKELSTGSSVEIVQAVAIATTPVAKAKEKQCPNEIEIAVSGEW